MKFCPKCEIKLKKNTLGLQCSKCGHTERQEEKQRKKITDDEANFKCPVCGDVFDTEHKFKQHKMREKNKNIPGNYYGYGKPK